MRDHARGGEPLAWCCGPATPGSNTAADHIEAAGLALAQLPAPACGARSLVRADSGGGTHEFLTWLTAKSRRLHYSVGMTITEDIQDAIGKVPADAWTPAYDGDGQVRDGAWVADITGLLDLDSWPARDAGHRPQGAPAPGRAAAVHRHRRAPVHLPSPPTPGRASSPTWNCGTGRRARCEDRIRCAKDTGLRNLPLKGFAQNQLWCEIVALACELLAWTQMLALAGDARRWEPKRLRLRLFSVAGRLVRGGRRLRLRLAAALALGRAGSPPRSPGCRPSRPADQPEQPLRPGRRSTRARGTPPTRRDSRAARHDRTLESSPWPVPQPATS